MVIGIVIGVVVVIIIMLVLWWVATYNRLVTLRNRFKNAFSQIDVQLQRRHDLIPNLVEAAKGYMAHERETLDRVISARGAAMAARGKAAADPADGGAMTGLVAAEGALGGAMRGFFGLMENYPDLKADKNISQLMEELTSTENKVAFARQAYNDSVMTYNTQREVFPASLVANNGGFQAAVPFELEDQEAKKAPKVSFS